jgi:hypothetical protein
MACSGVGLTRRWENLPGDWWRHPLLAVEAVQMNIVRHGASRGIPTEEDQLAVHQSE